ncbi:MAG: DUF5666 domain-containing protein [Candidatus Shapirobacteria bacterium]|nr:DUF5666 domain-containing protein [Candidatus Shapirobacteria bacterium]
MKNLKEIFSKSTIIVSLIALIIGFFGGFIYQKSKMPSFPGGNMKNGQFQMAGGSDSNRSGNRPSSGNTGNQQGQRLFAKETIGEVTSVDDSSITVKTPDGSSKIVMISDSTTVNQATKVDKTNLKVGSQVSISGNQNTDGTVTGKIINLNSTTDAATPVTKN